MYRSNIFVPLSQGGSDFSVHQHTVNAVVVSRPVSLVLSGTLIG